VVDKSERRDPVTGLSLRSDTCGIRFVTRTSSLPVPVGRDALFRSEVVTSALSA